MKEIIDDDLFVELSEKPESGSISLRYNRQKRLENSPDSVKLLHSPDYIKRQSLFASIWSNRGHRFIFIIIILLVALNFTFYFYYNSANSGRINNIRVKLDSFEYNGELLVNLSFSESKEEIKDPLEVAVVLKAFNKNNEEVELREKSALYLGARMMLHFKFEFSEINRIEAIVSINDKFITLLKRV